MAPHISVIIPVHNRELLLPDAVRSVLLQRFSLRGPGSLELIVVDDGSTDGTLGSLQPFRSDPRLRVLDIPHCGMPGAVRNRGVEAARGRWIAFLDSDDIWLPEKLEQQMAVLAQAPGALAQPDPPGCSDTPPGKPYGIIHGREIWLRDTREAGLKVISQKSQRHRREGDIFQDSLQKCIIGPSTVVMERSLFLELGGFREDMEVAEDYEFWLRLTALHPVAYLNEPCIIKRAGQWDQLSEKYGQIEKFRIQGLQQLVEQGWFLATAGDGLMVNDLLPGRENRDAEKLPPPGDPRRRAFLQSLGVMELKKKCTIHAEGCEKRGKMEEAMVYRRIEERV